MKIKERIKNMGKFEQAALAIILSVLFAAILIGAVLLLFQPFRIAGEMIIEKTGFIIFSEETSGMLLGAGLLLIFLFVLGLILSKDRIKNIKDLLMGTYNAIETFAVLTAGMITDFLLIIFACMNFNKLVEMSPPEVAGVVTTGLAVGILALGVRSMIRPIKHFGVDYLIRKHLNTNEDIEYED